MPYITREDGVHFVVPSYRDVLAIKQPSQLKKEILLLSQNYGEYITLQKKASGQYEVAFSPDMGYLLGESIWHYFKRPVDMIYCEMVPNTTEAILVIVKAGGVYLDGRFPVDSIPEELVIFLTQQNNFEIYIYGDVPISQTPENGKFSFDSNAVKSFSVLKKPVFLTLPLLKTYQLQLVDPVLKMQGIGVFPTKNLILGVFILGFVWMSWSYLTSKEAVKPPSPEVINPYLEYSGTLNSPAPENELHQVADILRFIYTLPGWVLKSVAYSKGALTVGMQSTGGTMSDVLDWANQNHLTSIIKPEGMYLSTNLNISRRPVPKTIYPLKEVVATFVDKLASVYPGNRLRIDPFVKKGVFTSISFSIRLDSVTTVLLELIGEQCKDLPLILQSITANVDKSNNLTGTINMEALGD